MVHIIYSLLLLWLSTAVRGYERVVYILFVSSLRKKKCAYHMFSSYIDLFSFLSTTSLKPC